MFDMSAAPLGTAATLAHCRRHCNRSTLRCTRTYLFRLPSPPLINTFHSSRCRSESKEWSYLQDAGLTLSPTVPRRTVGRKIPSARAVANHLKWLDFGSRSNTVRE